jgi:hypothetical protein
VLGIVITTAIQVLLDTLDVQEVENVLQHGVHGGWLLRG